MNEPNTAMVSAPDHVPEELIWPHSLTEFTMEMNDPFLAAARLHENEGPGIIWAAEASLGKPGWVLTRNDLIREAYMDYEHFSSTRDANTGEVIGQGMVRMIPVEIDPPEHHHYRRILNPLFTPMKVKSYETMVQQTCDSLIDSIEDKTNFEYISEFAELFPNSIFLSLVGLPQEELPQFLKWERQLLRSGNEGDYEKSSEAAGLIFKYLHGFATGPHICLGVHLAKQELRTALAAFLSRFSSIRMKEGEQYQYHTGGVLGVDRLSLVLIE